MKMILTTLAILAGTQAVAGPLDGAETRSITVHFADLNLSKPSGVHALRARIDYAARLVCGDYQTLDLQRTSIFRNCVERARDAALAQIELPVQ
jgi:UrcA family protein